ncbi:helix-turn-helix domain-containing protein [Mycobacteroides abscessus]|uniref:helix-turn-helix domain-containing protein n=1 Tax=Mycobacteroides abscessus TaxID=36809 RepID=UPI000C25FECA|nr:helix-turn-helix transcriptional regulator [Mycobacteroides abscessus]
MDKHGDTNKTVASNVARLRGERRLSLRELADMLPKGAGWIGHSGIRAIEANERAVTVDNLTALANVFEVSPTTLLMPYAASAGDHVGLTGLPEAEAAGVLGWLQGVSPAALKDRVDAFVTEGFRRRALPEWAR